MKESLNSPDCPKMTQQTWNAQQYINQASFVPELAHPVLELLKPKSGETILDLGCGDGTLTLKIAEAGASVHGIDSSDSMIEAAKTRGLSAEVGSGENLQFNRQFDAVFSNAALHWMPDYNAVINGVNQALKDQGRFVGEFGGQGNIGALIEAMETIFTQHPEYGEFKHPWFFPSATEYQQALEARGFQVNYMELIPRPTPLKTGVREWLKIFARQITQGLNQEQKEVFDQEAESLLKPVLYTEKEGWVADYVRLRFAASKVSTVNEM
jgi:2-isopropylmalate synthase